MSKKLIIKKKISYQDVILTTITVSISYLLSNVLENFSYFSTAFYLSLLYLKLNPYLSSFVYLLGGFLTFNAQTFYPSILTVLIILPIFLAYKRNRKKVKGEIILYSIIAHLPFIIIYPNDLIFKLFSIGASIVATFTFISSSRVIFIKKFDYKLEFDELFCLSVFAVLIEMGFIGAFNLNLLKSFIIFTILVSAIIFGGSTCAVTGIVLSFAPAIYTFSLTPIAVYTLLAFSCSLFISSSKILSAFSLLATDMVLMILLKVYGDFVYTDIYYVLVPIVLFLFLPNGLYAFLQRKTKLLTNKNLSKYAVNRMRASISSKLYGVSEVFSEMQHSFTKLKDCVSTDSDLIYRMIDEVVLNVCDGCMNRQRCLQKGMPDRQDLFKIFSVGIAKNRLSLIDLNKHFTENCAFVNGVIFEMNSLLSKYKEKVKESEDVLTGKELIKMQSEGVAGVLKGMAFDFSKSLSYSIEQERAISNLLHKKGIPFSEIMVLGEGDFSEINIVLENDLIQNGELISVINLATDRLNTIVSKTAISSNVSAITIKKSPMIDAAFGLSVCVKDGSHLSGDTHSLEKIDEGKFLIALSDGMGSGLKAKNTSATAISLIESFYKAGLESNLILSMVNKVLALNTDDNFSAMDIVSVNLFSLTADFIKIGAPYSFILTDSAIKIIEGASLPLGILDDLSPTSASVELTEGSTILMFTDGISDAFGSSTDLIDFLRTIDNKNPQQLTDGLIKRAIELDGSLAKDDMTALAIRLFKKVS